MQDRVQFPVSLESRTDPGLAMSVAAPDQEKTGLGNYFIVS